MTTYQNTQPANPGIQPDNPSRRRFLGQSLAITGTAMFSSLLSIERFASEAAAQRPADDYKALVCVFLVGGNDSYNMLIPTAPVEYARYAAARGDFALVAGDVANRGPFHVLHPESGSPNLIGARTGTERSYAIHPAMSEMQTLFDDGVGSFVANMGNLAEPLTKAEYLQGDKQIPKALFSHRDQRMQWQNASPNAYSPNGWATRFPAEVTDRNASVVPMNVSLTGNNIWQTGPGGSYVISHTGSRSLAGDVDGATASPERLRFEAQVGAPAGESLHDIGPAGSLDGVPYDNLFQKAYGAAVRQTVDLHRTFSSAFEPALQLLDQTMGPIGADPNEDGGFEQDLRAVAAAIAAGRELGLRRQVFFVELATFDHHSAQLTKHTTMLGQLSRGLSSFWDALEHVDARNDVVTFTASEFGRSLKKNGSGTDHAWGGNQWVMGGPVAGSQIFGSYPDDLSLGGPNDVEANGRILPTTAVDEVGGELASWFGVPSEHIADVFPNVTDFYDPAQTEHPVGFLNPPDAWQLASSCGQTAGRVELWLENDTGDQVEYSVHFFAPSTGINPAAVQTYTLIDGERRRAWLDRAEAGRWWVVVVNETIGPRAKIFSETVNVC